MTVRWTVMGRRGRSSMYRSEEVVVKCRTSVKITMLALGYIINPVQISPHKSHYIKPAYPNSSR
jgi:hypothetical protein